MSPLGSPLLVMLYIVCALWCVVVGTAPGGAQGFTYDWEMAQLSEDGETKFVECIGISISQAKNAMKRDEEGFLLVVDEAMYLRASYVTPLSRPLGLR